MFNFQKKFLLTRICLLLLFCLLICTLSSCSKSNDSNGDLVANGAVDGASIGVAGSNMTTDGNPTKNDEFVDSDQTQATDTIETEDCAQETIDLIVETPSEIATEPTLPPFEDNLTESVEPDPTEPEVEPTIEPTEPKPTEPAPNDPVTTKPAEPAPTNPPTQPTEPPSIDPPTSPNREDYVGRFKIPSTSVDVACYASNAQDVVDVVDSAVYLYSQGHVTIGDHVNQGFDKIKSCQKGAIAYLETDNETMKYTCIDKIEGHNDGSKLTDANWDSIRNLYPGALVCYTCNDNWQNVTIVFFAAEGQTFDSQEPTKDPVPQYGCGHGYHVWAAWEIAWEVMNSDGNYYGWDKRVCKICSEEEWKARTEPSPECEIPEPTEPADEKPEEVDPGVG